MLHNNALLCNVKILSVFKTQMILCFSFVKFVTNVCRCCRLVNYYHLSFSHVPTIIILHFNPRILCFVVCFFFFFLTPYFSFLVLFGKNAGKWFWNMYVCVRVSVSVRGRERERVSSVYVCVCVRACVNALQIKLFFAFYFPN